MSNISLKQLIRMAKKPSEVSKPIENPENVSQKDNGVIQNKLYNLNEFKINANEYEVMPQQIFNNQNQVNIVNSRIQVPINSIFVANDIISTVFESYLLGTITSQLERYIELHGRRVQKWGGTVTRQGLKEIEELPSWSKPIIDLLVDTGLFEESSRPNHLLINHYDAGSGILPHTDGPAYHPIVVILSLKNPCKFSFYHKPHKYKASQSKICSIHIPRRSLLIFKDEAYTKYLHGIEDIDAETPETHLYNKPIENSAEENYNGERISITFRYVPEAKSE